MNMRAILQSSAVALGVFLVFFIQNSQFESYSTYLLAIFIIFSVIYITLKRRSASSNKLFSGEPIELFAVSSIIVFIITLTQGLTSPLFFFLYFILFLLAFLAEPVTVWVFLGSIILFFIPEASARFNTETFIKLGSLILLSPIAYFIGNEFARRQRLGRQIEEKTQEIITDASNLKEESGFRDPEEEEALDEIIEEAKSLHEDADK